MATAEQTGEIYFIYVAKWLLNPSIRIMPSIARLSSLKLICLITRL